MEQEYDILIGFLRNLRKQAKTGRKVAERLAMAAECQDCSYSQGYINQSVFLCKTCNFKGGICIGCCLKCHEDHEIIELGPKKRFRCDCGTGKTSCAFKNNKALNRNDYNHNFEGRFCVCDREDIEETRESDMHICRGCYDWFHVDCIQIYNDCHNLAARRFHQKIIPIVPQDTTDYFFLCEKCVQKHIYIPKKYIRYIYLETACEFNIEDSVEKYPYHIFVHKSWETAKDEECKLEVPDLQYKSIKRKLMEIGSVEVSSDEDEVLLEGRHEDQINLAHGLSVIRELLAHSAQDEIRNKFRLEIKEFKRKVIENQNRLL